MDTRERILEAVRAGLGGKAGTPESIAAEAAALLRAPELVRPHLPNRELAELFAERAASARVGATVQRISGMSALPDAVRAYLAERGLPPSIALQPAAKLSALDWDDIAIRTSISPDERVGVGLANWGIAETGSLVFHSGSETPVLFSFLPLHHVVALEVGKIVAHLEDYAAAAASAGPPPRNVNLITGASGTTDIEGSYVRGAHGPAFLHIVLVDDLPV